jgi:hypothetical protein
MAACVLGSQEPPRSAARHWLDALSKTVCLRVTLLHALAFVVCAIPSRVGFASKSALCTHCCVMTMSRASMANRAAEQPHHIKSNATPCKNGTRGGRACVD